MTSYTAIANTDIDVDSPVTTGLVTLLRDNPIAITEGSSGAPKIQTAALDSNVVTTAKIASSAVTATELASNAVTTAKISNSNVTRAKLNSDVYPTSAWVKFNGTTVDDSYNIASVSASGSDYNVNFTTAMANANYAVVQSSYGTAPGGFLSNSASLQQTTSKFGIDENATGIARYFAIVVGDE